MAYDASWKGKTMKTTSKRSLQLRALSFVLLLAMLLNFVPMTVSAAELANAVEDEMNTTENGTQAGEGGGDIVVEPDTDDGKTVDYSNPVDVISADELQAALAEGIFAIRIAADFELDRTFYVISDAVIIADEAHTLKRSASFGGDIFVVGETESGDATEKPVVLTVGKPDDTAASMIIIDGNSENMTADVVGTVFFIREGSRADLYHNLTVKNNVKVGNEKTKDEDYKLSYPVRIGGAVAIVSYKAAMRVYGGLYTANSVNDITDSSTDEGNISSQGGVIYNYGTLDIFGGTFDDNHAGRGGALYNYRTMNIYKALLSNNTASTLGGAIYVPNSTSAFLFIGEDNDVVESSVTFVDNIAESNGGAIYAQHVASVKNTNFIGNITVGGNGGAISAGAMELYIERSVFKDNTAADGYGGAIYISGNNGDEDIRELLVDSTEFIGNSSKRGGAVYMSGQSRGYLTSVKFIDNSADYAGAVYATNASIELNGAEIKNNTSVSNGGALSLYSSASAVMNNVTADGNSSSVAGFVYLTEATLDIYNSTVKNNSSDKNGGAIYAYTGGVLNAYNTAFTANKANVGGAVMIYNGGLHSMIHSCTFEENSSTESGGAIYISNKSLVDIYNVKGMNNSSLKGGFMYETTAGTVVTLVGLVVSGNTATEGGAIIWGNTFNAKLYIDKIKYVDSDYNGDWNDEYWATAIYNKLTVYEQTGTIPSYEDYSGETIEPPVAESITNVTTAAQLERALEVGYTLIRITADFELDRTFYITSSVTIFTDEARTLKRAADFGGDIFVVGEDADGTAKPGAVLTLSKIDGTDASLTISGNASAMTVDVVGTVIFVCTDATANLGKNLTIDGHTKVGNDRVLNGYSVSYPPRVGGAVAIVEGKGLMNIYGGIYSNNKTNDITDASTDEGSISSHGGAFYNYGTMNIYGGRFEGNHAGRGGALYNYRTMNIYNATIVGNTSSTFGGAIYMPNSTSAYLYIGADNDIVKDQKVYFTSNSAVSGGGAVYANNLVTIENTVFEGNSVTGGNGGALYASSTRMTLENVEFNKNTSSKYGGAIYLTGSNELDESLEMTVKNSVFNQNDAVTRAGAIYMSGSARAYFEDTEIKDNISATGAAFYLNTAVTEFNGCSLSSNTATGSGGVFAAYSSSTILINDTVIHNNSSALGGAAYLNTTAFSIYNSTVSSNISSKSGGAVYAYTDSTFNAYNTLFKSNSCVESGGALMLYTGGTPSLLHSCTFESNTTESSGGAIYISNKSLVDMYNITATGNSAAKGGFMYETTAGTVVNLVGLTVSGNTATAGGSIIWGNTKNAKLNIDKSKYKDNDTAAPLDSAYWSAAIYNLLTVKEISADIPKYLDYGNEPYDNLADAIDVSNANELEAAINSGIRNIRIVADFEIDRTFYITGDVTIFTTISHTLTRAADFGGDFFVIGESADGKSALLMGANAKLTLGNPLSTQKNLLVFDGNKENMTVDVVGSVLFIGYSSIVNLHENVTVQNFHKVGNERTLEEKYLLGIENRIGGTLAVIASGTLNIYGGYYANNTINDEGDLTLGEAERNSTVGALIFNSSNLNIYGGTFEGNSGARGGVIYNYRVVRIFGGSFIGNHAYVSGGVYYAPNSAQSHLYVGTTDGAYGDVVFRENTAESSGGVIYASTLTANVIYGHASFIGNATTASGSGGAICMYGQLTVRNCTFDGNIAINRGGAIYASKSSLESVTRFVEITGCTFTNNCATLGGALSFYASATDYPEGAIATVTDCEFTGNKATVEVSGASSASGGAIYADRKVALTVKSTTFTKNTASTEAGVAYIAGESVATFSDCTMTANTSSKYGGAISVRSSYLTIDGTEMIGNSATSNGGAIYVSYQSSREINSKVVISDSLFESNATDSNGGAIYATRRSAIDDEWDILTIKDTVFKSNSAGLNGGALYTLSGVGVYIENAEFTANTATVDASGAGGAFFIAGSNVEINGAAFDKNSAQNIGGALKIEGSATVTMNQISTPNGNSATLGGFVHIEEATLNIYNSTISANSATKNGGAIYAYTGAVLNVYNTVFSDNTCVDNGGAVMIYTGGTQALLHSCTFTSNVATGVGGALYISNKSLVDMYNITATDNSAAKGGFMYETTSGTVVNLVGLTVSGNTAASGGAIIWGNTVNAKLNIDKSKYTDTDTATPLDDTYWSTAIYNLLTVAEISGTVPSYDDYTHSVPQPETVSPKPSVSVDDVFNIAQNSSDGYINNIYDSLPVLDKSSNFLSDGVKKFENINGTTVTVDSLVYAAYAKDGIASASEGILIYQAMLYKQAHPDEDVSISISSYRFSIEAAVNINRNSRYFGYMRNLVGCEYDEFGFVRIAYLLVSAAKMGINVTVIGQLDAYPTDWREPSFYDYFTARLDTPCDERYATGVVSDYMNFSFCHWTLTEKGGTDMMHTKLCAVSHYLDMNGVAHKNAVWTSSSNLDGIVSKGYNANWKLQTATIISDHEYIYRVSYNYLRLISEYCGQEQIYEFQDIMSREGARQIELILSGRADEIPPEEQLVYLGTENDDVFELYFTPFAGGTTVWDEANNPYCKYLRELYNSEDSIIFVWNAAEYNSSFALGQQMEDLIVGSFYGNKNVENKFYGMMENFDGTKLSGLTVGVDIGMISLNKFAHNHVHNKDILMSYVKNGQRYYVSLLNSCNMHSGSMCYQSNFMLVIKETDCEEDSVFFTMADLSTKGIVEHTYDEEQTQLPENDEHGYYYIPCIYCDKKIITGTIHCPGEWIVDKEATLASNGIQHKECTVCGIMVGMKEVAIDATEEENTDIGKDGMTFSPDHMVKTDVSETPLTIEALIKLSRLHYDRGGIIVSNYDEYKANLISLEIYENGQVRLYTKKNGIKSECFFDSDIRSDTPVHIAVTVSGSEAMLYINGTLADTQTLSGGMPAISTKLNVGGDTRYLNDQYFKGEIYSVALFSDVRTEAEIAKDMLAVAEDEQGLLYSSSYTTEPSQSVIQNSVPKKDGMTFSPDHMVKTDVSETPLTIEALIKLSKLHYDRGGVIVSNYDNYNANPISLEIYERGQVRLYTKKNGIKSECFFDSDIRSDTPVHIAVTVSGSEAMLYINGTLADTKTLSGGMPAISTKLNVGGDARYLNGQYFKGEIYSVALFSDVRTEAEITKDMLAVAEDEQGLLYSSIYTTAPSKSEIQNTGLTFNKGTSLYLNDLAKTPLTIEAIISLPKKHTGRGGVVFGNYDGSTNNQLNLEIYENGAPRLYINRAGVSETVLFDADVRKGAPIHVAVVLNGNTAALYLNGELADTQTLHAAAPTVTSGFIVGGDNRANNAQYFKGTIYAIGLYSESRSAEQIANDSVMMDGKDSSLLYLNYFTKALPALEDFMLFSADTSVSVEALPSAPHTIEATVLVGPNTIDRAGVIVGNYDDGTGPQMNLEIYHSGIVRLFYSDGVTKGSCIFSQTDIRSDSKRHIAVTVEGKIASLFVDGELKETSKMLIELPSATENFKIGGDNRTDNSQYFKGAIYSVYMFDDARSAEEIRADMVSVAANTASLIYSYDKTKASADIGYRPESQTYNQADINKIGDLSATPYTMEALVRVPTSVDGRAGVIFGNYIGGNTATQMALEVHEMGRVRLFFVNQEKRVDTIFETDIRSDAPVHIAITVEGTLATLYLNGKAVETATLALGLPVLTNNFVLGGDNRAQNTQYFKGEIYSLALFGDVRTAEEISADAVHLPYDAESLIYSIAYGAMYCNPYSTEKAHLESDWIVDREATSTLNGIRHKECLTCGSITVMKEISGSYSDVYNVDLSKKAGLTFKSEADALSTGILASKPMTFEALLQLTPGYSNRAGVVVGSYDGGNGNAINLEIYTDGNPRLYYKVGGVGYSCVFNTDIRSKTLTHIALTIDGLNAKLYVNGALAEEITLSVAVPEVVASFNIGNDTRPTSGQYFKGTIYGVTIFDDVRTADEIADDAILVTTQSDGVLYSKYYSAE